MPWIRFLEKFDYHIPGRPVTLAYKPGQIRLVTTPCAKAAKAAGKAVASTKAEANEPANQNW